MSQLSNLFDQFKRRNPDATPEQVYKGAFQDAFKEVNSLLDERLKLIEGFQILSERRVAIGQLKLDMEKLLEELLK